jgi:2-deoxy-D-gluconate 3-dehydrogenase
VIDLTGKAALVTGGSRGIGKAIGLRLARQGADVAFTFKGNAQAARDTAAEIEAIGRRALPIQADASDPESADTVVKSVLEAFGKVDILVNNAGIIRRADSIDFSEADWDAVMDTNLKVVFFLTQAFAKQVLKQGGDTASIGKIINIASLLSFQGGIRVPSYTASKSGLAGLTKILANEWASKGINVNAIAPGYFDTNNTEALRNDADRNASILARIPAGRWGQPGDLGGAAVFLASQAADYVQGITLPVDGGWLAR